MAQKFNSDLEIPKYLKQKESNISKAIKKSKHKHQYEECLLRYRWNFEDTDGILKILKFIRHLTVIVLFVERLMLG